MKLTTEQTTLPPPPSYSYEFNYGHGMPLIYESSMIAASSDISHISAHGADTSLLVNSGIVAEINVPGLDPMAYTYEVYEISKTLSYEHIVDPNLDDNSISVWCYYPNTHGIAPNQYGNKLVTYSYINRSYYGELSSNSPSTRTCTVTTYTYKYLTPQGAVWYPNEPSSTKFGITVLTPKPSTTSVSNYIPFDVRVCPTPSSGIITFTSTDKSTDMTVKIYDLKGRLISADSVSGGNYQLRPNLIPLSAGKYYAIVNQATRTTTKSFTIIK